MAIDATAASATCEPTDQSVHTIANATTATKSSTNRSDSSYVSDAETYTLEKSALGDETSSDGAEPARRWLRHDSLQLVR